jgi:hypothetical protein
MLMLILCSPIHQLPSDQKRYDDPQPGMTIDPLLGELYKW